MNPSARRFRLVAVAALATWAFSCAEAAPPAPVAPTAPLPVSAVAKAPLLPVEITLLYTSDEHGWLLPFADSGALRGGAAEVLGLLKAREGHCVGSAVECPDARTLLLSGGDNYTGPAISSYFSGEPMADAMGQMGYAAVAFGNHELDFGRPAFVANRRRSGAVYLGANVHATDAALKEEMELPAFTVLERRGVKIGVVGLATESTLTTAAASLFVGVSFEAEEAALSRAIPSAWAAGADAVVLIAHECPDVLVPIVSRHPDWDLSFVGAGHCHEKSTQHVGSTPVVGPGWRFERYVRAKLTIDRDKPAHQRARAVTPELVDVARDFGDATAPIDATLARANAAWKTRLDQALGEPLGYTEAGFARGSTAIGRWIAGVYRAELRADVAILNASGIRQALPKGLITKATVWSLLPFNNTLVVCRLKGRDLIVDLETEDSVFAGVEKVGKTYRLAGGKALDPGATYTVVTIDFLYHGGSKFKFQSQDPAAKQTGIDWRVPLIGWMQRQKTSPAAPLEQRIDPIGGGAPQID